ncbi:MAG: EscU/YscU/HrcU family type III secretion system export apparatus switch protein [Gammaproteobacteria bacterium]|nr:EscU/YscU/HrcU family type III secretion system export apparatus switch protein [Gammaproteobacteria bacterium]
MHAQVAALRYDGQGAPRVVAKGQDELARRILEVAREHDVPIVSSPEVVSMLGQIPLEQEIPASLYVAVAEVLAFAYSLSGRAPPGPDSDPGS